LWDEQQAQERADNIAAVLKKVIAKNLVNG
jgi:hypothetical protein